MKTKISKFLNRVDGKIFNLTHTAANKSFKNAKKNIGLRDKDIIPYSLRYTHTSYLLSKGISIEYIS
ncbi:hypothetical protein [Staphylococcus marylandisciuri]|uniref:hypothetical protein n=1 Tax=Staphylococcus marylandisciuri TaxID=2981529 RepID=UPI0035713678